jgi:tripartite-type tricarboxylate transporter receptor subunit TctC
MKLPRRTFLHLAVGAAVLPAVSRLARAQDYPTRPVRIVVGFAPGGLNDINARLIGHWLSERLGQQFIIDNRPGASGNIAMESVVRSPPDGYTLVTVATSSAVNATLFKNLPFNFLRDIAPVGSIGRTALVMEVHPSVPAATGLEFIAYAKANPNKLDMASPGSGTGPHMASELFKLMTGVSMIHVPYRGSGLMLNDLLSGQVQFAFDAIASSIGHIRAGRLRALGVGNATRVEVLPDVPASPNSCRAMRRADGSALAHPGTHPAKLSISSTGRSTPDSPIPGSGRGLPTSAIPRSRSRRPSTASSSPKKPRNGRRW